MKFALLAPDDESQSLARAARDAGHEIGAQRELETGNEWEDLVDDQLVDAVIVGRGSGAADLRARQVQELARLGRPMLLVHPLVPSVLSFFEIDMARGESGAVVQHFNPLLEGPIVEQAAAWVRNGHPQLGPIEQILATRALADRSRENVERRFARDVELLGQVAGRLDRLGAHAAGSGEAAYAALSVQLLGQREVPVRWAVEPAASRDELRLTLVSPRGRATIVFDEHDSAVEQTVQADGAEDRMPLPASDPAAAAISKFVGALESGDAGAGTSTWPSALRSMELTDSIEISLRRGRMIEIHDQQLTEQLAFKGTMAALSCGVLVLLVPLLLVAGWIAGLFGIPVANYWPHVLLVLLALFLGLQLLPKLLYPPAEPTPHESDSQT